MESIIILAGDKNVGKTTTLREFAKGLLLSRSNDPTYHSNINTFFANRVKNGKNEDLYLIIPTQKGYVFVATKGDDAKITTANAAFFSQDYKAFHSIFPNAKIYIFDENGNESIVTTNLVNYYPYMCFSGAHLTKSVMQPLLSCAKAQSYLGEGIIINMRAHNTCALNLSRVARYKAVLDKLF